MLCEIHEAEHRDVGCLGLLVAQQLNALNDKVVVYLVGDGNQCELCSTPGRVEPVRDMSSCVQTELTLYFLSA